MVDPQMNGRAVCDISGMSRDELERVFRLVEQRMYLAEDAAEQFRTLWRAAEATGPARRPAQGEHPDE